MKKIQWAVLPLVALLSMQTIQAQTVDEIVDKHVAALGGKEKLSSIKTVIMEGNMSAQGQEIGITITRSHMTGQRVDISVMGMTGYQINTPTEGWAFMPFGGQTSPEAWPEDQVKSSLGALDLQGNLNNYKDKGTQLELLGKEAVDGEDAYKIKAVTKAGITTTYFISTKTHYILRSTGTRKMGGEEREITTTYSNYKPTADGFVFAFTTDTPNGAITFDKIEVNKPVDPKLFTPN